MMREEEAMQRIKMTDDDSTDGGDGGHANNESEDEHGMSLMNLEPLQKSL